MELTHFMFVCRKLYRNSQTTQCGLSVFLNTYKWRLYSESLTNINNITIIGKNRCISMQGSLLKIYLI
jgi:hypothetical protein